MSTDSWYKVSPLSFLRARAVQNRSGEPPTIGPFKVLEKITPLPSQSSYFVRAKDVSSETTVCLKIIEIVSPEKKRSRTSMLTELEAYMVIAESEDRCEFLMSCHGAFQDIASWYFAMVSERVLLPVV